LTEQVKEKASVVIGVDLLSGVGEWFGNSTQVGTITTDKSVTVPSI
jgi:hypothetical protein